MDLLYYDIKYLHVVIRCSGVEQPVQLVLPDQWLWELIDEFIYQFQSFSQYRARVAKRSREEIDELTNNYKYWNVLCVLNVLHSLVDKSNIKKQLEVIYLLFSCVIRYSNTYTFENGGTFHVNGTH